MSLNPLPGDLKASGLRGECLEWTHSSSQSIWKVVLVYPYPPQALVSDSALSNSVNISRRSSDPWWYQMERYKSQIRGSLGGHVEITQRLELEHSV